MPTPKHQPFNPAQLATWKEATIIAKTLGTAIAGGVKPQVGNPRASGIYIPTWFSGPGSFQQPAEGKRFWLHFRFQNGMEGFNVGLIREQLARYPKHVVIGELAEEMLRWLRKSKAIWKAKAA